MWLCSQFFPNLQLLLYILVCTKPGATVPLSSRTLNKPLNFSQHQVPNDKISFVPSTSKDCWTVQQDNIYENASYMSISWKSSGIQKGGEYIFQITLTSRVGRDDCSILCSGTFSLLGQKKTNARGNPQSQVLFQRQKTD